MSEDEPFNGFTMPHEAYGKNYYFKFYPVPNENLPSSMVKQMIDHELPGIMAIILSPFKLIDNF